MLRGPFPSGDHADAWKLLSFPYTTFVGSRHPHETWPPAWSTDTGYPSMWTATPSSKTSIKYSATPAGAAPSNLPRPLRQLPLCSTFDGNILPTEDVPRTPGETVAPLVDALWETPTMDDVVGSLLIGSPFPPRSTWWRGCTCLSTNWWYWRREGSRPSRWSPLPFHCGWRRMTAKRQPSRRRSSRGRRSRSGRCRCDSWRTCNERPLRQKSRRKQQRGARRQRSSNRK